MIEVLRKPRLGPTLGETNFARTKGAELSFSIIIPSSNAGLYIEATIRSVLKQNYRNFEIIVVDNESSDSTADIVTSLVDSRIKFVSKKDRGQLDAVLNGIEIASGEILHWLNADDILLPNALEHVANVFSTNDAIDLVYADSFAFDETKHELYVAPLIRDLTDYDHFLFYRQFYSECVFWRRHLVPNIPDTQRDFRVYTDYAFFVRLKWGRRKAWTMKRLGAFRIRADQMSQLNKAQGRLEFETVRTALRKDLGWSHSKYCMLKLLHFPSFLLRQKIVPALGRILRVLYRAMSKDRDRKDTADLFFSWVVGKS